LTLLKKQWTYARNVCECHFQLAHKTQRLVYFPCGSTRHAGRFVVRWKDKTTAKPNAFD